MNTKFLQMAIDQRAATGGGTVVISKGKYLSGALFLKAGVNLELLDGAILKGSTNFDDYPGDHGTNAGSGEAGIASCSTVNGKYIFHGTVRLVDDRGMVRDSTLFKDDYGGAYFNCLRKNAGKAQEAQGGRE